MFEHEAFDDGADDGLFVGVEAAGGFEIEAEVFARVAFVGAEGEFVGADAEGYGDAAQHVEGGLAGAGLIADLGDVHADLVGERGLADASLFADGDESVSEVHGLKIDDGSESVLRAATVNHNRVESSSLERPVAPGALNATMTCHQDGQWQVCEQGHGPTAFGYCAGGVSVAFGVALTIVGLRWRKLRKTRNQQRPRLG